VECRDNDSEVDTRSTVCSPILAPIARDASSMASLFSESDDEDVPCAMADGFAEVAPMCDALQRGSPYSSFDGPNAPMSQVAPWNPQAWTAGQQPWGFLQDSASSSPDLQWMPYPLNFHAAPLTLPPPSHVMTTSTPAPRAMMPNASDAFQQGKVSVTQGDDGFTRVMWIVGAQKLRTNDRTAVSPLFELFDGRAGASLLPFKMIINPSPSSTGPGGASFKNAHGKGTIQLKCETRRDGETANDLTFWLSVSSGRSEKPLLQEARGPVTENFIRSGIRGLPKQIEEWDFPASIDDATKTFVVCLTVNAPWIGHA